MGGLVRFWLGLIDSGPAGGRYGRVGRAQTTPSIHPPKPTPPLTFQRRCNPGGPAPALGGDLVVLDELELAPVPLVAPPGLRRDLFCVCFFWGGVLG